MKLQLEYFENTARSHGEKRKQMVLVGAVILPHGTMSFDGQGSESSVESCRERYKGLPKDLQVLNDIYNRFHHLLEELDQNWIDGQLFADAIHAAGAPLENCWAFIDGTLRPCCRPIRNQRILFSGHKRIHGIKFQVQLSGLFNATTKACEKIAELKPDIVILHTPHGISLSKSVGVYMNSTAKGNALWNEKWDEFEVEIPLDSELALKIIQHFEEDGIDAQGVNSFARTESPLRWGEVVPLWYLEQQFKVSGQQPKYVILSQSMKRSRGDLGQDKMAIGKSLARFINEVDARVVFAVSGDLSHAHTDNYTDIPLYLPDPRWNMPKSDNAVVFDRAIEGWASSSDLGLIGSDTQLPSYDKARIWDITLAPAWLDQAIELQPEALSCGIGGFVVLHGILSQCDKNIHSQVFGRFAPTYYGMIALVFSPC